MNDHVSMSAEYRLLLEERDAILAQLRYVQEELGSCYEKLEEKKFQYSKLKESHQQKKAELKKFKLQARKAERRAEQAKAELAAIRRSFSWKITAPFRWFRRLPGLGRSKE